jgi:hypothetical protein
MRRNFRRAGSGLPLRLGSCFVSGRHSFALWACFVLFGCTGTLSDFGTSADGNSGAPTGSLPQRNNTRLDRSVPCTLDSVSRSPVRRLSHVEYERTLVDLFGDEGVAGRELAEEEPIHGFENNERGMNPVPLLVEQHNAAAKFVARRIATNSGKRSAVVGCTSDEAGCARSFIETFGKRVFRRPLTEAEVDTFHEFFVEKQELIDFNGAVELTLQAFLQSPQFLYRLEFGTGASGDAVPLDDWELATRLSYTLWQSMPDSELFARAEAGELSDEAVYAEQVERMLLSPKAAQGFGDFHRQWLELEEVLHQPKDSETFPLWNKALAGQLKEESVRFAELLYASGEASLAGVLLSRRATLTPELATLYGVAAPAEAWGEVELPAGQRAGILTRGAFLAAHARPLNGSPPLRGVEVLEKFLCSRPPEPPPSVDASLPEQDPNQPMTNRQLFESRTSVSGCQGCHAQIDGIGMSFEHYDSIGAYRATDNGLPVDASGELVNTDVEAAYEDAVGMSEALAQSSQVAACVSVNWYRFTLGRDEEPGDWCKVDALQAAAQGGEEGLKDLLRTMVTSYEFKHRTVIR